MLTTGRITAINLDSKNHRCNKYKIEIPIFKKPGDYNTENYTFIANCSLPAGINACYTVGDFVYVAFLDDHLDYPVIIGKIYQGINKNGYGLASFKDLSVSNSVTLPEDTKIGNISYVDIKNMKTWIDKYTEISPFYVEDNFYILDGGRISDIIEQ